MAKQVKIASVSVNPCNFLAKPLSQSVTDYVIEHLDKAINQVLHAKPDLIVLPEVCDRPENISLKNRNAYYAERGDKILKFVCEKARLNRCYIAYGTHRPLEDGTFRNSLIMIDRQGKYLDSYDKNHIVPAETTNTNILCGKDATIFNCDFGRVGAIICFDLNFSEIREKYKALSPDLMLFSTNFGGGIMRNFFAFDVGCYFLSSAAYNCAGVLIDPLGREIATTSNHYNYIIETINLDYAVVHLDNNWEKIASIREKYGNDVTVKDIGYVGVVLMTYNGTKTTMKDILKDFEVITAREYFNNALKHRERYTAK